MKSSAYIVMSRLLLDGTATMSELIALTGRTRTQIGNILHNTLQRHYGVTVEFVRTAPPNNGHWVITDRGLFK